MPCCQLLLGRFHGVLAGSTRTWPRGTAREQWWLQPEGLCQPSRGRAQANECFQDGLNGLFEIWGCEVQLKAKCSTIVIIVNRLLSEPRAKKWIDFSHQ